MIGGNSRTPIPLDNEPWQEWAKRLAKHLEPNAQLKYRTDPRVILLAHQIGTGNVGQERPGTPGIMMYDPTKDSPVFSRNNVWQPVAEEGAGYQIVGGILRCWGQIDLSITNSVAFPVAFSAVPAITATTIISAASASAVGSTVQVHNPQTTGCTIREYRTDTGAHITTNLADWHAIGVA